MDERSRERIESGPGLVFVSAATIWELEIKLATGRLRSPGDFEWLVEGAGYEQLAISIDHAKIGNWCSPIPAARARRIDTAMSMAAAMVATSMKVMPSSQKSAPMPGE